MLVVKNSAMALRTHGDKDTQSRTSSETNQNNCGHNTRAAFRAVKAIHNCLGSGGPATTIRSSQTNNGVTRTRRFRGHAKSSHNSRVGSSVNSSCFNAWGLTNWAISCIGQPSRHRVANTHRATSRDLSRGNRKRGNGRAKSSSRRSAVSKNARGSTNG